MAAASRGRMRPPTSRGGRRSRGKMTDMEFRKRSLASGCSGHFSAVRRRACERAVMWSYLLSDLAPGAAGARSLHILEKSRFSEAEHLAARDDQMIEHADVGRLNARAIFTRNLGPLFLRTRGKFRITDIRLSKPQEQHDENNC